MRVDAPPEVIFAYFTDPSKIVQWIGIEAAADPRPGGIFRLQLNETSALCGRYCQVSPHWRLVLTCGWAEDLSPVPRAPAAIEVSLTPDGDGTIVRLRHNQLPAEAAASAEKSTR